MTARPATVSARYMWAWTTSARTSARWAARAPTAITSSASSITRTATPARCSLRTALPADNATTDTSYRVGSMRVVSAKRCSCAPPFVPVARTSTIRIRRLPGRFGRSSGVRHGSHGIAAPTSAVPPSDEEPLDRLVDCAPVVLVGLVAPQEVEPVGTPRDPAGDQLVDQQDTR